MATKYKGTIWAIMKATRKHAARSDKGGMNGISIARRFCPTITENTLELIQ
ncbi:MAG: hypothetical protein M3114_06855 [Thermoproteota archaeon]|nr:hypothetical protein [Thermoproteota archaeon]